MKRSEIEIGVEYAEHGAMAYGRIPSVRPARVRFTSLDPQKRMVKRYRKTEIKDDGRSGWEEIQSWFTKDYAMYDNSLHVKEAKDLGVGGLFTVHYASQSKPGALPAEVTYDGGKTWFPHPVQPGAVHMTWAEYVENERINDEKARARRFERAPAELTRHWSSMVEQARILRLTEADLREWLEERIRHTVL